MILTCPPAKIRISRTQAGTGALLCPWTRATCPSALREATRICTAPDRVESARAMVCVTRSADDESPGALDGETRTIVVGTDEHSLPVRVTTARTPSALSRALTSAIAESRRSVTDTEPFGLRVTA